MASPRIQTRMTMCVGGVPAPTRLSSFPNDIESQAARGSHRTSTHRTMSTQIISQWAMDTGASRHMTGFIEDFWEIGPSAPGDTIEVAGGTRLRADGVGSVRLYCALPDGKTIPYDMRGVIYSRALNNTRLFSYSTVRSRGFDLKAKGTELFLLHSVTQKPALWAHFNLGLYYIQTYDISSVARYRAFLKIPVPQRLPDRTAAPPVATSEDLPSSAPKMILSSNEGLSPRELDELLHSATFVHTDKAVFIEELVESEETIRQQRIGMEALQHLTTAVQEPDDNQEDDFSDSDHSSLSVQGSDTAPRLADIDQPNSPSLALATVDTDAAPVPPRSPSPFRGPISWRHPRINEKQKKEWDRQYSSMGECEDTREKVKHDGLGGLNFW